MRALLALILFVPTAASANMASPVQPGTPVGEPAAALAGLRVVREALRIDLAPLGRGRPFAVIEATYRIDNLGEPRPVPLEFLALGGDLSAVEVAFDGRPVEAERVDSLAVPAAWTAATQTPALGGDPAPYAAEAAVGTPSGLRFTLTIPRGQHVVEVRYRVRAGSYDAGDHPNRIWQVAYGLAPARLWAGFGQLDVEVAVPEGWEAAASLPLRREGDRLVGRFSGVPGDVLAVSVRAPAPAGRFPLRLGAFAGALVIVSFAGWIGGRLVARAGRSAGWALPASLLGGVGAAALLVGLVGTADDLGDSAAFGYGSIMGLIFVGGPLALVIGTGLAQIVAWWTARRLRA